MTSPLLPYANSYLLLEALGVPSMVDGRLTVTPSNSYLVQCYLKRQDSTGTNTGGDYILREQSGTSGDAYIYRGYALRYAQVSNSYDLSGTISSSLSWTTLVSDAVPAWISAGCTGKHRQGNEKIKYVVIEKSTGKYGGTEIDYTVSTNIGGIPLTIRSGDVLN